MSIPSLFKNCQRTKPALIILWGLFNVIFIEASNKCDLSYMAPNKLAEDGFIYLPRCVLKNKSAFGQAACVMERLGIISKSGSLTPTYDTYCKEVMADIEGKEEYCKRFKECGAAGQLNNPKKKYTYLKRTLNCWMYHWTKKCYNMTQTDDEEEMYKVFREREL